MTCETLSIRCVSPGALTTMRRRLLRARFHAGGSAARVCVSRNARGLTPSEVAGPALAYRRSARAAMSAARCSRSPRDRPAPSRARRSAPRHNSPSRRSTAAATPCWERALACRRSTRRHGDAWHHHVPSSLTLRHRPDRRTAGSLPIHVRWKSSRLTTNPVTRRWIIVTKSKCAFERVAVQGS